MGKLNLEYFLACRIASREGGRKNNVMVRIASVSVAIGMMVMIISLAVIFGLKNEISSKLTGFGAHVQIVNLDGNTSTETVPISRNQPFLSELPKIKNFAGMNAYAIKGGVIRGEDAVNPVTLKGVDGSYDWSFFEQNLREGVIPDFSDTVRTKDVLISRALADLTELGIGGRMELLFIQQPPRRDVYKVAGIYDTQYAELDRIMVITDLRNVQHLNGWTENQVTGIEVITSDFSRLETFTDDVFDVVVNNRPENGESLRVVNIQERFPTIFDWLAAHDVNAAVIITIMLVVALFNMIAALLIILMERTSMIGILKALGMGNHALQKMFLIRSSFVILGGMFWGNVLGVGLCLLQYYTGWLQLDQAGYFLTTVPIYMHWGYWLLLNLVTFVFIALLMTLPTLVISRILPEKTIRFE